MISIRRSFPQVNRGAYSLVSSNPQATRSGPHPSISPEIDHSVQRPIKESIETGGNTSIQLRRGVKRRGSSPPLSPQKRHKGPDPISIDTSNYEPSSCVPDQAHIDTEHNSRSSDRDSFVDTRASQITEPGSPLWDEHAWDDPRDWGWPSSSTSPTYSYRYEDYNDDSMLNWVGWVTYQGCSDEIVVYSSYEDDSADEDGGEDYSFEDDYDDDCYFESDLMDIDMGDRVQNPSSRHSYFASPNRVFERGPDNEDENENENVE